MRWHRGWRDEATSHDAGQVDADGLVVFARGDVSNYLRTRSRNPMPALCGIGFWAFVR